MIDLAAALQGVPVVVERTVQLHAGREQMDMLMAAATVQAPPPSAGLIVQAWLKVNAPCPTFNAQMPSR